MRKLKTMKEIDVYYIAYHHVVGLWGNAQNRCDEQMELVGEVSDENRIKRDILREQVDDLRNVIKEMERSEIK